MIFAQNLRHDALLCFVYVASDSTALPNATSAGRWPLASPVSSIHFTACVDTISFPSRFWMAAEKSYVHEEGMVEQLARTPHAVISVLSLIPVLQLLPGNVNPGE